MRTEQERSSEPPRHGRLVEAVFPKKSAILLAARTGYRENDWTTEDVIINIPGMILTLP